MLSFNLRVVRIHVVVDRWLGAPVERSKGMSLFDGRRKGENGEEGIRCCWSLVRVIISQRNYRYDHDFQNN